MLAYPTSDYVRGRLADFDAITNVRDAEQAVALIFNQWAENRRCDEVLAKVTVLDRLYSTSVYAVQRMTRHIIQLNIDPRLEDADLSLVNDIANAGIGNRRFLSFASKYCSWHQPNHYQILDKYVKELLWEYRRNFAFAKFKRYELDNGDYMQFLKIVDAMVGHFGLHVFSRKELDKFLWIEGLNLVAQKAR